MSYFISVARCSSTYPSFCLAPATDGLVRAVYNRSCFVPAVAARNPLPSLARRRVRRAAARMCAADEDDGGREAEDEQQCIKFFTEPLQEVATEMSSLTELALFPLQLVMTPSMNLPLHIFELRYRLLFSRLQDGEPNFGIVLYDSNTSSLAQIGCSAELTRFEPLADGRIMTDNVGRQRFEIIKIIETKPYTRALVRFFNDKAPAVDLSTLVKEVSTALQDVLRLSNKLYDKVLDLSPDIKRLAPDGRIAKTDEQGWPCASLLQEFSFSVCQVLDMPIKEQQMLLQVDDTGERLKRQNAMLDTARKYLAAQVTIKEAGLGDL